MFDCLIVGGGLVGLATAYQMLSIRPDLKVVVCEKEEGLALHQSGRNSGVVHSGVYYKPGSLKAQNCIKGRRELLRFCSNRVSFETIHKVILANTPREEAYLQELVQRGRANEVLGIRIISKEELREIEPHASANKALYLPSCQIVDYPGVAQELGKNIRKAGGQIVLGEKINAFQKGLAFGQKGEYTYRVLVNCAGLYSDRIAKAYFGSAEHRILPFRGEYYLLRQEARSLVKGLIYPVPDPQFPFLGVHLTPMISGKVEAGPNAVLAGAREGYRLSDLNWRDLGEVFGYSGFWKMAARYWKAGAYEMVRSMSKRLFLKDVQRLVPAIQEGDLEVGGSGIRAQIVKRDGRLMDDFCFREDLASIHVLNAPSPAATSCFSIGKTVAMKAIAKLN